MQEENKYSDVCEDCGYEDKETGICVSHEGCIKADDRQFE